MSNQRAALFARLVELTAETATTMALLAALETDGVNDSTGEPAPPLKKAKPRRGPRIPRGFAATPEQRELVRKMGGLGL